MSKVCRIGDVGVGNCTCHSSTISTSGVIITGASISTCEDSPISRIGDIILSNCGHTGVIITGSPDVTCEDSPVARVGDNFAGCFTGVLVTGANTVEAN